jgi:hypothetical protein
MKIDKNYLGFRKWYNSNKGNSTDEEEKMAWSAWTAAMEYISDNYDVKERKNKQNEYYLE